MGGLESALKIRYTNVETMDWFDQRGNDRLLLGSIEGRHTEIRNVLVWGDWVNSLVGEQSCAIRVCVLCALRGGSKDALRRIVLAYSLSWKAPHGGKETALTLVYNDDSTASIYLDKSTIAGRMRRPFQSRMSFYRYTILVPENTAHFPHYNSWCSYSVAATWFILSLTLRVVLVRQNDLGALSYFNKIKDSLRRRRIDA